MSIGETIALIFSLNVLSFIAVNYLAFRSNKSEAWLVMMKPAISKIILFLFAIPALLIWIFFYVKGVLSRK